MSEKQFEKSFFISLDNQFFDLFRADAAVPRLWIPAFAGMTKKT
ncbi:Uncharacterized protein dnm_011090 [Desulfonema magnum]|uniref:Uncharacterized protein n=1 Tax=Desulfonema magnum TaxID=45655 RepID=A0A975BHG0_9BACT|nr:Uncharacterized protein dnm_011090 [Desulfonema magnum]